MKRIVLFLLLATLIAASACATGSTIIKRSTEKIAVFLNYPLDTLGRLQVAPDSVWVVSYNDGGTSTLYSARSTTFPFSAVYLDTVKPYAGPVKWLLVDSVGRLNAGSTAREIAVSVTLFAAGRPYETDFAITVISSALDTYLAFLDAAISSRSTFAPGSDSVIVDVSSAMTSGGLIPKIADTTWGAAHQTTRALLGVQTVTIPTVTTVTAVADSGIGAGAIKADAYHQVALHSDSGNVSTTDTNAIKTMMDNYGVVRYPGNPAFNSKLFLRSASLHPEPGDTGIVLTATGSTRGVYIHTDSGTAMDWSSAHGDAWRVWAPYGDGFWLDGWRALCVAGKNIIGSVNAPGTYSVVVQDTNSSGEKVAVAPSAWTPSDSDAYQGTGLGFSIDDLLAAGDTNSDTGTVGGLLRNAGDMAKWATLQQLADSIGRNGQPGSGLGDKQWNIYVIDTSKTPDALVSGVRVSAYYYPSNTFAATNTTDGAGKATLNVFGLTGGDSLTNGYRFFIGSTPLYTGPTRYKHFTTDGTRDTIKVYSNLSSSSLACVFLQYTLGNKPAKGALLVLHNDNVATDTTTGKVIGPILETRSTDGNGEAWVLAPKSYIYHDSLKSLVNISLIFNGRTVAQWPKLYIPNQDTLRLTVKN